MIPTLIIWYHYCDVRVNSKTTDTTIRAGHMDTLPLLGRVRADQL